MTDQADAPTQGTDAVSSVSFNLDAYVVQLTERIEGHLATLRNTLRAIDEGSYLERSETPASNGLILLQLSTTRAQSDVAEEEIRNTFHEMMRSFGDFVDTLLAMERIRARGVTLTRAINGLDELEQYLDREVAAETSKVAHDRSLSLRKKVYRLATLEPFSHSAFEGYVDIRDSIEHHKSIARNDIEFWAHEIVPTVDGQPIPALPQTFNKGQRLGTRQGPQCRTFAHGQPIILSERDLEGAYRTIMFFIIADLVRELIGQHS